MAESTEKETETFCGVCRHPTPGHEPDCPVYTGSPHRGLDLTGLGQLSGASPLLGAMSTVCPYCGGQNGNHVWAGSECPGARNPQGQTYQQNPFVRQGQIPTQDGYEVAKIYREAKDRLLQELAAQVEVNRLLCKDLIDARLKLAEFKLKYKIVE